MALFETAGELADLLAHEVVVDDPGGDGDGPGQGQAGGEHGGHGVCKLARRVQLIDVAEDRDLPRRPGQVQAALLRVAVELIGNIDHDPHAQQHHPPAREEVGDGDQGLRDAGQLGAVAVENGRKGRDDLHHDDDDHNDGDDEDEDRVGQRPAHAGAHAGLLVQMAVHGAEGGVDAAGLLPRADRIHKGGREQLAAALLEARRDRASGFHVLRHLGQDPLEDLVGGLFGDQVDRAGDGDARAQDDGKLAAHHREGLHVDPCAADVTAQEAVPVTDFGQAQDNVAGFLDAFGGVQLVIALDQAGDALPVLGNGGILIGYQRASLPLSRYIHVRPRFS